MKYQSENLPVKAGAFRQARIYEYLDGSVVAVPKRSTRPVGRPTEMRGRFPPVKRNEPMTKAAFRKTLNRYFERLYELDLEDEKCRFVTLTISKTKYNSYDKICGRFKHFIYWVREKVKDSYVGVVRFIEIQEKGFFHIHCILVFDSEDIKLTWRDLYQMWGWGFVKVKPVNERFGLIDYLTNQKHSVSQGNGDIFTRYPKGARIIYISPNLPKARNEHVSISSDDYTALLKNAQCVHAKVHKYIERGTKKVRTKIDRIVLVKTKK